MMKKKYAFLIVLFIHTTFLFGQKFGVVDMKSLLERTTEYKNITTQLDILSVTWENEIAEKELRLKRLKEDFKQDELFYTDNIKQKKIEVITALEKETYELSKKYFGYEGDLFKKRQELMKPVQDKIYDAIQRVAKEKILDLIIDKSAGSYVLYMEPKLDITIRVLQILGF